MGNAVEKSGLIAQILVEKKFGTNVIVLTIQHYKIMSTGLTKPGKQEIFFFFLTLAATGNFGQKLTVCSLT